LKKNGYIIVGATGGLGRSIIKSLDLSKNDILILVASSSIDLEDLRGASQIVNPECQIQIYKNDLSFLNHPFDNIVFPFDYPNWEVYLVNGWSDAKLDDIYASESLNRIININYASNVFFVMECLKYLNSSRTISISVIGSIAILKSRSSNVIYTCAKLALKSYVESVATSLLNNKKFKIQYIVMGFMKTTLNHGSPLFLTLSTVTAAKSIIKALRSSKKVVVYVPYYWNIIALLLKIIPSKLLSK